MAQTKCLSIFKAIPEKIKNNGDLLVLLEHVLAILDKIQNKGTFITPVIFKNSWNVKVRQSKDKIQFSGPCYGAWLIYYDVNSLVI